MTKRFTDKIVLITGGTSGMGLATARKLSAEGAQVVITGRDKVRLDAVVAELGPHVLGIAGDATDLNDLDTVVSTIRDRFGRLDAVFANAGIGAFAPASSVTEAEFHRVVDANFKSVFFTIQKTIPLLVDGGSIVINSSFAAHRGLPDSALYSATKAAALNLARTFAAELSPRRIRVNSISPGYTDTPAFRAETSAAAQTAIANSVPAARIGTSEEVAAAVAFLVSAEAAYINGQDLLIDGGLTTATPAAML
ncbi:glucose 1-dehydrogenase [Nocardia panacis]|uniref:Glucose 1-dehydrogenase n=1 Tax=Nocardia panacis TaxID=2340916 RepID=A0A3A4KHL3_9NOCA|nr:glucose 1-dehydrogenase [Nocardia panacis]RJO75578.1 glucose 1-dehydrogenase [Nocardia panacis]